jgi:thiamine-monophosphate kinase
MDEDDLVHWLVQRLPGHPRVPVGAGDDAAVLQLTLGHELVATSDMLMDRVDFVVDRDALPRIGRKALAVNLSDLAAMAARPAGALVSLALPRRGGERLAQMLYEGLLPLAAELDCPIVGGDTNSWDGPLVISVTALGELPVGRRWLRSGARPGDAIVVTGEFGGSILGKQFDFMPRVREALWLAEHARVHAAIDVSDGLSLDLARLARHSGCGAVLELERVPVSQAARELAAQEGSSASPLEHALADGEDFELILAVPPDEAQTLQEQQPLAVPLTRIGYFVQTPGLFRHVPGGDPIPLAVQGYQHRFSS